MSIGRGLMKLIVSILSLLLLGCASYANTEPKFMYHQKVSYVPVHYYQKVCSGHATILRWSHETDGSVWYEINEAAFDCPNQIIYESKLKSDE